MNHTCTSCGATGELPDNILYWVCNRCGTYHSGQPNIISSEALNVYAEAKLIADQFR